MSKPMIIASVASIATAGSFATAYVLGVFDRDTYLSWALKQNENKKYVGRDLKEIGKIVAVDNFETDYWKNMEILPGENPAKPTFKKDGEETHALVSAWCVSVADTDLKVVSIDSLKTEEKKTWDAFNAACFKDKTS
ncbi:hypothetical protein [Candidatus Mycoplasma haematohominis]|uniref:hypothetical protein n=1 Tax=Candidatus Mycoplasma haematohominis TaxID=1494318 RepID=UPI001C0A762D|nr:hypothetical protein [Candidatus Mycoplasma haemohominis]